MRHILIGTVLTASLVFAQESPSWGFDPPGPESPAGATIRHSILIRLDTLGFLGLDQPWDQRLEAAAQARGEWTLDSGNAQGRLALWLDSQDLAEAPERVVNEAWFRYHGPGWSLQAGLIKPVWGRADALRVLDVLTPMDRRRFVLEPILEQKIAQPLLLVTVTPADFWKLELAWSPWLEGDRIPTVGPWVPRQMRQLLETTEAQFYQQFLTAAQAQAYAAAYAQAMQATNGNHPASNLAAQAAVAAQAQTLQIQAWSQTRNALQNFLAWPERLRWENGQAGVRLSGSAGPVDLGLQYWYGFHRLPSFDPSPAAIAANGNRLALSFDRVHHAGLDLAFTLAGVAVRAEGAWLGTPDVAGDDPRIRNPSVAWNLGLDRDLGGPRAFLELRQSVTLFHDRIVDPLDVQADSRWAETIGLVRLQQDLFQDTFSWELTVLYGFEDVNAAFLPKLVWKPGDLTLELSGFGATGKDDRGLFSQFYENRLVRLTAGYRF